MKTREEIIAELRNLSEINVVTNDSSLRHTKSELRTVQQSVAQKAISVIDNQWSENHTLKECLKNQMQCVAELKFFDNEKAKLIGELEEKLEIATKASKKERAESSLVTIEGIRFMLKSGDNINNALKVIEEAAERTLEQLNQTKTNNDK